jgi:hypothetical protein
VVEISAELFGGDGIVAEIEHLPGTLASTLFQATARGVEYVFDDSIDGLEQDEDPFDPVDTPGQVRHVQLSGRQSRCGTARSRNQRASDVQRPLADRAVRLP